MIEEIISFALHCDDSSCNNIFDGDFGQMEIRVISDAEEQNWMVDDQECYCPDHRPNVEDAD